MVNKIKRKTQQCVFFYIIASPWDFLLTVENSNWARTNKKNQRFFLFVLFVKVERELLVYLVIYFFVL